MTAAYHATTVRDALVRLEGDIRDLDPSVHGDDLAAATQMALDDVNSIRVALDALVAQAGDRDALVEIAKAARVFHDKKWKPGDSSIEAYNLRVALAALDGERAP